MPSIDTSLVCPGCGAPLSRDDTVCEYCGRKVAVTGVTLKTTNRDVFKQADKTIEKIKGIVGASENSDVLAAEAFNMLHRGQYAEAARKLDRAQATTNNPDIVFYDAVAHYKCQEPYEIDLDEAESIIATIDSAVALNPDPQYFYAKAFIIREVFEKRFLSYEESSQEVFAKAVGLNEGDKADIESILSQ
ncbi:zinc ribbon domain-containing protein [Bifidobacterium sp. ESL0763]|uniref:zinc ribbon domain-containing protein n=1 Tax=Bifidobacterium sp. ESL0763 TaxID=2983227 RepID=UPI0023F787F2|nr:zinc ribbon domain-containing protein [Bifidobacterium sp. ESL0763]MDF7663259.1 zinc ribbon domain-containing protein [Bifidobacterium sp. ESL0763]